MANNTAADNQSNTSSAIKQNGFSANNLSKEAITSAKNFTLRIRKIEARNLQDVEMLGKNDPFVILKIGDIWNGKTDSLDNTGAVGDWVYPDSDSSQMVINMTRSVMETAKMQISVFDENTFKKHGHIGDAEQDLSSLISTVAPLGYGEAVLNFDLINPKGKPSGVVSIVFGVQVDVSKPKKTMTSSSDGKVDEGSGEELNSAPFDAGILHIKRIKCFDLKNVEKMAFMGDQNDPYVVLRLGSWDDETERIDGGGANPLWEYMNMKTDVTSDIIAFEKLKVQVYDHNSASKDVLIGSADATLYHAITNEKLGTDVDVTVILKDEKQKTVGRVVLGIEVRPHDGAADSKNAPIAEGFKSGLLQIVRIRAFNLKNTELFGKQDPYVQLSFGTMKPQRTITQDNAGSAALWDFLDMSFPVSFDSLCNTELTVEAWDDNNTGDTLIGSGTVSVRKVGSVLDKEVELDIPLVGKDGKSAAGQIVLYCKVIDPPPEVDPVLKEEIEDNLEGKVRISRVTLTDVVNTEFFGKQVI